MKFNYVSCTSVPLMVAAHAYFNLCQSAEVARTRKYSILFRQNLESLKDVKYFFSDLSYYKRLEIEKTFLLKKFEDVMLKLANCPQLKQTIDTFFLLNKIEDVKCIISYDAPSQRIIFEWKFVHIKDVQPLPSFPDFKQHYKNKITVCK